MAIAISIGAVILALVMGLAVFTVREVVKARSDNPLVWEKDIRAFEKAARNHVPPANATLFVGSSSIRFWRTLKRDMHPIPVVRRGFGGSKLADLDYYAKRLVDVNCPRAIVVFSGTNDITPSRAKDPRELLESFRSFVTKVKASLPAVHIYYIAITPSPLRWKVWPVAQQANQLIQDYCATEANLKFIDTTALWLGPDGQPDRDNYLKIDRLHPSSAGYANWTRAIRPVLLEHYPEYAERERMA